MIHRAPMTRKEMTEEDIKLRQGRSKEQYRTSAIGVFISMVGMLILLIISCLI